MLILKEVNLVCVIVTASSQFAKLERGPTATSTRRLFFVPQTYHQEELDPLQSKNHPFFEEPKPVHKK